MIRKEFRYVDAPKKDRSGQKIGSWTILSIFGVNRIKGKNDGKITTDWIYKCVCGCGNIFNVRWKDIANGSSTKCRSCSVKNQRNHNYKGTKDIPGSLFSATKSNALKRNLEFNITIEDTQKQFDKQKGLCYYSGQKLIFYPAGNRQKNNVISNQASLDRIDSSKGYVLNNIVWSTKTINRSKSDLSKEDFISMCSAVYKHNRKKKYE